MNDYITIEDAERAMLDNCDIEFLEEYRIDRQKEDFCEIQPYYEAVLNYQQSLSIVPSADVVERKRGEWIESDIPSELYVCSECGGACWSYDYTRQIVKSRYCPNCGADMRGVENEID